MWQSLESAPKNEQVLVYEPDAEPQIVAAMLVDNHLGKWWQYSDHALADICPDGPEATHWMPLPAIPEQKE